MQTTDYVSDHFTYGEVIHSQTAGRLGIGNNPGPVELAAVKRTAQKMERVRHACGDASIDVSSWFRCHELNENPAVGSKPTSAHPKGNAVDCTRRGWTPRKLWEFLTPLVGDLQIDQLILEFDGWCHIGFSDGTPRGEVFTIGC